MKLDNIIASVKQIDFEDLEITEIGSWPIVLRLVILLVFSISTFVLGNMFIIKNDLQELSQQKNDYETRKKQFKDNWNISINLDSYKQQMEQVKDSYKNLLKQMPSDDQLPELIDTLTHQAQKNKLKYQSIKPGDTKSMSGFYKEMPLDLTLTGSYNGFGGFVSDVTKLPRIVTMQDFDIKPNGSSLTMSIQLKAYWLASDASMQNSMPSGKAGVGGFGGLGGGAGPGRGRGKFQKGTKDQNSALGSDLVTPNNGPNAMPVGPGTNVPGANPADLGGKMGVLKPSQNLEGQ